MEARRLFIGFIRETRDPLEIPSPLLRGFGSANSIAHFRRKNFMQLGKVAGGLLEFYTRSRLIVFGPFYAAMHSFQREQAFEKTSKPGQRHLIAIARKEHLIYARHKLSPS